MRYGSRSETNRGNHSEKSGPVSHDNEFGKSGNRKVLVFFVVILDIQNVYDGNYMTKPPAANVTFTSLLGLESC